VNLQASDDFHIAVDRISALAFYFILSEHKFEKAIELADEAIRVLESSAWAIRRAELADGETSMTAANDLTIRRALELAGVEFIDENGGGPGVRLRKGPQKKH